MFQQNVIRNLNIFVSENEFGIVICKVAAFLSRPWCYKTLDEKFFFKK